MTKLAAKLDQLAARLAEVRASDHACLLSIGWGGGLLGKSAYLKTEDDSYRKILRQMPLYQRAIQTGMPFPKTRRVVFEGNQPASLPGWVMLEVGSDMARRLFSLVAVIAFLECRPSDSALALSLLAAIALAQTAPPEKIVATSSEIMAMVAKAKAERKPDQPTFAQPLLALAPYGANLEYRAAVGPSAVHKKYAEFFYVIDGSATLVTGGKLVNEKSNGDNLSGTAIEGGFAAAGREGRFRHRSRKHAALVQHHQREHHTDVVPLAASLTRGHQPARICISRLPRTLPSQRAGRARSHKVGCGQESWVLPLEARSRDGKSTRVHSS